MITFDSITKQGDHTWLFVWTDIGAAYYRIILNGRILQSIYLTTAYVFSGKDFPKYPPPLEVVAETELAVSEHYPPFLTMQWYAVLSCASYEVDQWVTNHWARIRSVLEGNTLPVYTVQTLALVDETAYRFTVASVDTLKQHSTPREFDVFMVTPPILQEDKVLLSYDQDNLAFTVIGVS